MLDGATIAAVPLLLDRYASFLPITEHTPRITLGEGATPLVRSQWLERETGIDEEFV